MYFVLLSILTGLMLPGAVMAEPLLLSGGLARVEVTATIATPKNPHGACFSPDGSLAYVACSADDVIAVIDLDAGEVVRTIPVPGTPLDVVLSPDGGALLVALFGGDSIVRVPIDGGEIETVVTVATGPSLFSSPGKRGDRYLVCERDDVVVEIAPDGTERRRWATGDRPYPAEVTSDGILLFVPNRDGHTVTVIDTLNNRTIGATPVANQPQGGVVTPDDVHYIAACGGADELDFINTASFEVVTRVTKGVGPRPFSVVMSGDGRYALVNNAGGDSVSILDTQSRTIVGRLTVGDTPIVIRAHPDGRRMLVMCEGSHHVAVVTLESTPPTAGDAPTEVVVMGMIHSGHRTSERYSLGVVRDLIRAIEPDDVCVEIPPNRFEAAMTQWREDRVITESRARVFPEYVDVLFPLLDDMDLVIVPTAGWTAEMNDYRRGAFEQITADPARAEQWAEHEAATQAMEAAIEQIGGDDDPRSIHTDAYDRAIAAGYGGPYNDYFNNDLADGGWDNINAKHYAHIARHLDAVRGQGRRVLITYGAAHKGWFLEQLRLRDDVVLLEVGPFLDAIGAPHARVPGDDG